jgi:hypothetical protein
MYQPIERTEVAKDNLETPEYADLVGACTALRVSDLPGIYESRDHTQTPHVHHVKDNAIS